MYQYQYIRGGSGATVILSIFIAIEMRCRGRMLTSSQPPCLLLSTLVLSASLLRHFTSFGPAFVYVLVLAQPPSASVSFLINPFNELVI